MFCQKIIIQKFVSLCIKSVFEKKAKCLSCKFVQPVGYLLIVLVKVRVLRMKIGTRDLLLVHQQLHLFVVTVVPREFLVIISHHIPTTRAPIQNSLPHQHVSLLTLINFSSLRVYAYTPIAIIVKVVSIIVVSTCPISCNRSTTLYSVRTNS